MEIPNTNHRKKVFVDILKKVIGKALHKVYKNLIQLAVYAESMQ